MPQSEGREVASSCRERLRERDTGGDTTTATRGDTLATMATRVTQCMAKGQVGEIHVRKRGAVSKQKRKRRQIKENAPGAASHHTFMSRGVQHHEKTPPLHVCEQEGVPYAPSESQRRTRKKEKEGGASQSEGTSQSEARGKACPRAMWGRGHIPKCGAKGRGRHRVAEKG